MIREIGSGRRKPCNPIDFLFHLVPSSLFLLSFHPNIAIYILTYNSKTKDLVQSHLFILIVYVKGKPLFMTLLVDDQNVQLRHCRLRKQEKVTIHILMI